VTEPIVLDTSCLIGLQRIEHLSLLPQLFQPILIPPKVREEFNISLGWLQIQAPENASLVLALEMLVNAGEAEAIVLAKEKSYRIVLDDLEARAVGKNLGLRIIGTIGLLVTAKRRGLIPNLSSLLDRLETVNFRISKTLRREALEMVGEL